MGLEYDLLEVWIMSYTVDDLIWWLRNGVGVAEPFVKASEIADIELKVAVRVYDERDGFIVEAPLKDGEIVWEDWKVIKE